MMKAKDVHPCNPPKYDEISVANLYEQYLKMEGMTDYFPDEYPKGRHCSRSYFFSILANKHPQYTEQLILKCKKDRFGVE